MNEDDAAKAVVLLLCLVLADKLKSLALAGYAHRQATWLVFAANPTKPNWQLMAARTNPVYSFFFEAVVFEAVVATQTAGGSGRQDGK